MNLLEAWQNWDPNDGPPYMLDMDVEALNSRRWQRKTVTFTAEQADRDPFLKRGISDRLLHLGLYPLPFTGNLGNASIYVLLANPSANIGSYKQQAEYRRKRQLGQEFAQDHLSLLGKGLNDYVLHDLGLGRTVRVVTEQSEVSNEEVLANLAVIELSPYWSRSFIDGANKLPSADLAVKFVEETVVPRVRNGEAVLIVTRRVRDWNRNRGLPKDLIDAGHIVLYKGSGEARAASLRPHTPGGKAILRHFGIAT